MSDPFNLRLGIIADPHVNVCEGEGSHYKLRDPSLQILEATLKDLENQVDYLFFPGDLIDAKYEPLRNLDVLCQALKKNLIPSFALMGNHDTPHKTTKDAYKKTDFIRRLSGFGFDGREKGYWRFDVPGKKITFLGLDTAQPFTSYGSVDKEQRAWFQSNLENIDKDRHVFVFMHHPTVVFHPVISEVEGMDMYVLNDNDSFLKLLCRYPQIKAVISGHLHAPYYKKVEGIHFISCPSIVSWPNMFVQFVVNESSIEYTCRPIRQRQWIDQAFKNLCCDEHSLRNFGTAENIVSFYTLGARKGSFQLS